MIVNRLKTRGDRDVLQLQEPKIISKEMYQLDADNFTMILFS